MKLIELEEELSKRFNVKETNESLLLSIGTLFFKIHKESWYFNCEISVEGKDIINFIFDEITYTENKCHFFLKSVFILEIYTA